MAKGAVIGLDIGTTCVRAAEVELAGGGRPATLVRYGEIPLPPGAVRDGEVTEPTAVVDALKRLWSTAKFSRREVNIGVGNQRVVVRELTVPRMPMDQVRASLPFQVQELLPMPVEEALLDFYPTAEREGPSGPALHGMLVAATRDTVNANVMAVESAGLRPQMVDLSSFALVRALIRGELAGRTVAIVEIGARVTHVVVTANGVPRLVRILATGGENVTAAVASAMGVASMEAEEIKRQVGFGFAVAPAMTPASEAVKAVIGPLVEAVRNTFVYYSSNNPGAGIEALCLTGGGSQLPGLGQALSSASRLPAAYGDALVGMRLGKALPGDQVRAASALMALPIGLAMGVAA